MLSALNDAIPDEILSEWETGGSNNTNGGLSNGNVDPSGNMGSGNGPPQMGNMNMPPGMRSNVGPGGQMNNPNMNLVNALNKNKVGGPPASSDSLTSINSSMHSAQVQTI